MKNILIVLSSLVVAFAASVALDRLVGSFQPRPPQRAGLIFPPDVEQEFRTPEFSYTVHVNSLGFRDREFDPHKTARTRILAIGDSFTYGWGVDANQSWPKVLEAKLRAAGYDVEVANLGVPGGSPRNYAAIAEQVVPLLKPDLVIVAVLQGDDLAQLAGPSQTPGVVQVTKPADNATAPPPLQRAIAWLYPHLLSTIDKIKKPSLMAQWKKDAQTVLTMSTPVLKARFERLDRNVQEAFTNGELNPALVYLGMRRPDYFLITMDMKSPNTEPLVLEMANQLGRIAKATGQNHTEAIVVSVPYGIYVSQNSFRSRQRLGFEVVPAMLTTTGGDDPIRKASEIAGLSFNAVTTEFRQASLQRDLFFELDGHFNAAGHEYFAAVLMPRIQNMVERDAK